MDSEGFSFDDIDLSELDGATDLPPPEVPEEPQPEPEPRPERRRHVEPDAGPWFVLSLAGFVLFTLLVSASLFGGGSNGELMTYLIVGALLAIYCAVFIIGSFWFGSWQRHKG